MRLRAEFFLLLIPIGVALATPLAIEHEDGDFMDQTNGAVPITDISPENLAKHTDDYVSIYDHCTHDNIFWFQEGADEYEYHPIKDCEQSDSSKVTLIAILSGDSEDNWEEIESGKLDFWSGRLIKGLDAEYQVKRMLKRDLDYDEDELWVLEVGVTPTSVYKENKLIAIIVWCICLLGFVALIVIAFKKIQREKYYSGRVKLINVLNDQENNQYHLVVDLLRGTVTNQDDFVVNNKFSLNILKTIEYWDEKKGKNLIKLVIDKEGAKLNWKALFNKQFGIKQRDFRLE